MAEEKDIKLEDTEEITKDVPDAQDVSTEETSEDISSEKIKDLEAKIKDWEDKYMRLYAEYDNYQKRTAREKDARYADALVDVVAQILPVADNLDRALAITVESEEAKNVLDGVNMVKKQLDDALSALDVSEIPALGEEFDPNLHNAVMHIEDENVADNTIVEEFMRGYRYKEDRVIRYSMVKVAN